MSIKFLVVLILFSGLLVFSVNDSYGAAFLKIGDIKGESTDEAHKDWIELLSFSQSIDSSVKSGGENSFAVSKTIDKSTPNFVKAITQGTIFPEAVIEVCDRTCYKTIVLRNVMVSSYALSSSGDTSEEAISFVFESISEKEEIKEKAMDEPTFEPDLEPEIIPPTTEDEESVPPETDTKIEEKLEKKRIPDWIKTNARWWSDDKIGDSDFVGGIQHLMKEKIIDIPDLPEQASETAEEHVPDWIKTNARWWADDRISEDEFVSAIKYLVEQGIIRV